MVSISGWKRKKIDIYRCVVKRKVFEDDSDEVSL